jgi:AraC-like DNA-binding protein
VVDVICTSGPGDRAYEERHSAVSVAIVTSGTFEYHTTVGRAVMTPGSMLLGTTGRCFECGHAHGAGDRCISFRYETGFFERLASDAGAKESARGFAVPRLPPLRDATPVVVEAHRGLLGHDVGWEELAIRVGAVAARLSEGGSAVSSAVPLHVERRISEVIRELDRSPERERSVAQMAAMAGLSAFHFLRTFTALTGVTPHQYLRRARLREAALRLRDGGTRVIDVAFDSGFADLSAFNKAFRAEFGVSPRSFRRPPQ